MKRALSRAFDPPAAIVPVRVRAPEGADWAPLDGKLDTGADLCALPDHVLAALDVAPVRMIRAAGFSGTLAEVSVFRVDIALAAETLTRIEALATRRPYAILGRNVLRRFLLRLDGPRETLELRLPSKR